jgi:hypothetical protein
MMEAPALFPDDTRTAADAPLVWLDLPDREMAVVVKALSPDRVSYPLGAAAKRIAANINRTTGAPLSPRERNAAIRMAYRFRRQMPNSVIAILSRWPEAVLKGSAAPSADCGARKAGGA